MANSVKPKHSDDAPIDTPSTALSNGIQVYETWDEMLDSWQERARVLANEMQSFGFASVWLASSIDPTSGDIKVEGERDTEMRSVRRGGRYTCLGMLEDYSFGIKSGEA